MKAKIISNEQLLGIVDLKVGDYHMGGLYGIFTPTSYYIKKIQPIVWQFNEAEEKDFTIWNNLNLSIQLEDGLALEGVGGITIDDYSEMFDESMEIGIAGVDTSIIDDLFKGDNN